MTHHDDINELLNSRLPIKAGADKHILPGTTRSTGTSTNDEPSEVARKVEAMIGMCDAPGAIWISEYFAGLLMQHLGVTELPTPFMIHKKFEATTFKPLDGTERLPPSILIVDESSWFNERTRAALAQQREHAYRFATCTYSYDPASPFVEPKLRPPEDRDNNPHKAHLARGAQWKREKGRRR